MSNTGEGADINLQADEVVREIQRCLLILVKNCFGASEMDARLLSLRLWPEFTVSRGCVAAIRTNYPLKVSAVLIANIAAGIYIRTNSGFFKGREVKEMLELHKAIQHFTSFTVGATPKMQYDAFYDAMMDF